MRELCNEFIAIFANMMIIIFPYGVIIYTLGKWIKKKVKKK